VKDIKKNIYAAALGHSIIMVEIMTFAGLLL